MMRQPIIEPASLEKAFQIMTAIRARYSSMTRRTMSNLVYNSGIEISIVVPELYHVVV